MINERVRGVITEAKEGRWWCKSKKNSFNEWTFLALAEIEKKEFLSYFIQEYLED